jgi:O-acetyl-ADP-ribose deacetylase (regulator of RNase III)
MSKLGCTCGNVIRDGQVPNEVEGSVLSDKGYHLYFDSIQEVVDDFLAHFQAGRLPDWKIKHFNPNYPEHVPLGGMLADVLQSAYLNLTLAVLECDQCGRLWIQKEVGKNEYAPYAFDGTDQRPKILGLNESPEFKATLRLGERQVGTSLMGPIVGTRPGRRILSQGDIVEAAADAIVFSTNEHLFLSGGAGASLLGKHGKGLQEAMHRALAAKGIKVAPRGSVFEIEPAETWGRMFAVVAANGFYETSREDTEAALKKVLKLCALQESVKSVTVTALGTGYGNMEIEDFVEIFCRVNVPSSIETFELLIHGDIFFKAACRKNEKLGYPATVSPDVSQK